MFKSQHLEGSVRHFGSWQLKTLFKRLPIFVMLTTAILLASTVRLLAQVAGTGTIQGTITDSSGAVVPNAEVIATMPATGYATSKKTSNAGVFVISALPPGVYSVKVNAPGFQRTTKENIAVNGISVVGLDFSLSVGVENQEVVVSSAPPELNTQNGALDITIPSASYTALPLAMNGGPKNPLGFQTLVPGVSNGAFGVVNINGGVDWTSYDYINGLPILSARAQGDTSIITVSTTTEVVDQFQIISSGAPAYYSGQGITNFVTKSGTNQLHGDAYENVRNTVFDAAGYFSPKAPIEHQNEYGASVGGPIRRDRLFFFGNIDRFRIVNGNTPSYNSLPTDAEQSGDFSALPVAIYDPATTSCTGGVCTRQPFPGNKIPADRISNVSNTLQSALPKAQNSNLQNNFLNAFTAGTTQNTYLGKLDGTINSKQHAYLQVQYGYHASLGLAPGSTVLPPPYASAYSIADSEWVGQVGHTWEITPNLVNVFGSQYSAGIAPQQGSNASSVSTSLFAKAGLSGMPPGAPSQTMPNIAFGGPNSPTSWDSTNNISYEDTTTNLVFQDNLQWTHGKHSVTFGGQEIFQQDNVYSAAWAYFGFSNSETAGFNSQGGIDTTTGNAYASYLLGDIDFAAAADVRVPKLYGRYRNFATYVQDDWKVNPKLVVNVGLRYLIPTPWSEAYAKSSWLDPTLPNPAVAGFPGALQFDGNGTNSCHCTHPVQTHYREFDPRIGMAYSLTSKTVLRGAFGINHFSGNALGGNLGATGVSSLGYSAVPAFGSPDSGITPAFNWNSGFPGYTHPPFFDAGGGAGFNTTMGANASSIGYLRPSTGGVSPYTENWNVTLEHSFMPDLVLSVSYAGSESHHIGINGGYGIYSNQIQPKYLALGNLLQQPLTPTTLAQAQAIMPGITMPYANFVGSIGQALRPFPQYSGINDPWAGFGNANYNALQTYLSKRMSNGLYFLASYTWSKRIDNTGGTIAQIYQYITNSMTPRSAYNLGAERSVSWSDIPQMLSVSYVYSLPFGHGHAVGNGRAADLLVGGWQFSGILQYSEGAPLGAITGSCNVPYTGGCFASYGTSKSARINGSYGSGNPRTTPYLNVNAFQNAAPFTFGNTPRTLAYGLRNPWNLNENLSLGKDFSASDRVKVRLQADAFNVFNRTVFGGIGTNISSSNFGYVGGQANQPRKLQFEAYVKF